MFEMQGYGEEMCIHCTIQQIGIGQGQAALRSKTTHLKHIKNIRNNTETEFKMDIIQNLENSRRTSNWRRSGNCKS